MQSTTSTSRFLNLIEFKDYVQDLIDNDDYCFQEELNLLKVVLNGRQGREGRKRVLEQAGYTDRMGGWGETGRDGDGAWDWVEEGKIYFCLSVGELESYIITKHPSPEYPHYIWYVEISTRKPAVLYQDPVIITNFDSWKGPMWVKWSRELICGDRIPFLNWYMESPFGVKE